MACQKISDSHWDWKTGVVKTIKIGGAEIPFNYFSCGTYYFDGEWQVVKFPKGMQLYHGSGALANANVEFPTGPLFYNPHKFGQQSEIDYKKLQQDIMRKSNGNNENIPYCVSKFLKVSTSWFADPRVAKLYSQQNDKFSKICQENCINVYELRRDVVFILLDNNFNLWRMLNDPDITKQTKDHLKFMFKLEKLSVDYDPRRFGEIDIKNKVRRSYRDVDIPFATWLCKYFQSKDYAGYAANTPLEQGQQYFHLEFMFCNPLKWLKRNLDNTIDWQHNKNKQGADIVKQFIQQLKLYKTFNVDFHAGNLYEHSVWSLLFAESILMKILTNQYSIIDNLTPKEKNDLQRKIAAIAFIHDIGKMNPSDKNSLKRDHDYVYYAIPTHPIVGSDYITGVKTLPILDENMKHIDVFNMPKLLTAFGFEKDDIKFVSDIIKYHWDFGDYLSRFKSVDDITTAQAFIDHIGRDHFFTFFFTLVIVSVADILASQPFNAGELTTSLNPTSQFFPFISNVPKKYRGGTIAVDTATKRESFANLVLRLVHDKK